MHQRFGRVADFRQGGFDLAKRQGPLCTHQIRPDDCCRHNNRQGPAEANRPTHLNEQRYFYQRYGNKS